MAEIKTKPTQANAMKFLESVEDLQKRADSLIILRMLEEITNQQPVMWGNSMIGFDQFEYKNSKGEKNYWPVIGFSPRKQNLTLYIMPGFERFGSLLEKLGKHTTSKGCLYIKRLSDVDVSVLRKIAEESYRVMKEEGWQA
jgi:hypothetical protein